MRRLVAVALVVALPACTVGVRRSHPSRSPSPVVSPVSLPACSTAYAAPDPKRPVVRLAFDVDAAHERVTGTERVTFTPDLPVDSVVLRLWLNGPGPAKNGGHVDVTRASLPMSLASGGTLLRLALPAASPPGRAVTFDLDFAITLPRSDVDRWGHTTRTAWWASAHPLLAWVRGSGWVTDPAVGLLGESATSEVADYDVTVTAPAADVVLGNALTGEPKPLGDKRSWHFRNRRARDVGVVVGPFETRRTAVDGVPVLVAVSGELAGGKDAATVFGPVTANATESLRAHAARFGPYPFDSLTVVALKPVSSAGVEYPGLVFVGTKRYDVVVPHEVAHQWFYGLVGDDQGRDPWLDEAFATYAEALFNDSADNYLGALNGDGAVGRPMTYWDAHRRDYSRVVYGKGAAALLTAREEAGADAFDRVLRCYVARNAYRVVSPADLVAAFAPLPKALAVLRDAGALSR